MPRLRELYRLREQRISGIMIGVPVYIPAVLELRGYKLKFYDLSDVKIGEIGSDVKEGRIESVNFELLPIGCGAFSFVLDDFCELFDITYRTRVDIHPYFDPAPWFTGFIQTLPQPGQERPYEYTGFGFFEQLAWVTVTGSYEDQDIAEIVKTIISTMVAPNTQIIYNAAKVETTSYIVETLDFYLTSAKDAIQSLADMATGYVFGVDDTREFYFRPIESAVNYEYWVGKHCQEIAITKNPFTVRNRLYIKVGLIQGEGTAYIKAGSNCIGYEEDAASIAAYGLREDVITAPDVLDIDDARQWAEEILSKTKDPEIKAKIKNLIFDTTKSKMSAIGKTRITTHDGIEYLLFTKKVDYSITSAGILGNVELE